MEGWDGEEHWDCMECLDGVEGWDFVECWDCVEC